MKRGQKVAVCHDGKWSRRVLGEVIATRRGHHIQIRFPHPETGVSVDFWARKDPPIRHIRNKKGSCIYYGDRYSRFSGWANIDWWMPWFAVYKWKDIEV